MLVFCLVYTVPFRLVSRMVLFLLMHVLDCREWALFGVMSVSAIGIWAATFTKPKDHRANGTCNAILLTIAAFSYYAMVSTVRILHHDLPEAPTNSAVVMHSGVRFEGSR